MKKKLHSYIPLFYSSLGLMLTFILITISLSIWVGGKNCLKSKLGKDKSIISVISSEIKTWEELTEIKDNLDVDDLIVLSEGTITASFDNKTAELKVKGINGSYWSIENEKILYGRLIDEEDVKYGRHVAVINEKAAMELYGRKDVVSNIISINGQDNKKNLTVIGVLKDSIYNNESICYISYEMYKPEKYKENRFFLVISDDIKEDIKSKIKQMIQNKYKRNFEEINEVRQLSFLYDFMLKYKMIFISTLILLSFIGTISFAIGVENYLYQIKDKLYVLRTFGIDNDKIKIKIFNKLSLFGLIILIISVIMGYIFAHIAISLIFIKPILYIQYIMAILSFGVLLVISAISICLRKLNSKLYF